MNINYIIIVLGEPYSTFSEILAKYFTKNKNKKIILIGNLKLLKKQLKKLNYSLPLNNIYEIVEAKKSKINIINIEFKHNQTLLVYQKDQIDI